MVKDENLFIGINDLNEYQLSLLYQAYCIWYSYRSSYNEFVKERVTEYPTFKYIYSHAPNALCTFKDTFRPPHKIVTKLLQNLV